MNAQEAYQKTLDSQKENRENLITRQREELQHKIDETIKKGHFYFNFTNKLEKEVMDHFESKKYKWSHDNHTGWKISWDIKK